MNRISSKVMTLIACGAMALTGVVGSAAPSMGGTVRVRATDARTWSPATKEVPRGTKVVWRNPSDDNHNVVSYKGAWSKASGLPEGGSTSFTFKKTGTFKYRCTLHSKLSDGKCQGMCGKIVVR